jgi:RND family efflux transporter MFP subunit
MYRAERTTVPAARRGGVAMTLMAGLALVAACTPGAPAQPTATAAPAARSVQTAQVERVDLSNALSYSGDVRTSANLTVIPKASGRVEKLYVDVGAALKAGDPIADLDRTTAQLQLKGAEAGLAAARARLAQMEAGPRAEQVEQAEASARAAKHSAEALGAAARPEQIAQAAAALDTARQQVSQLEHGRNEAVAAADAGVAAAQARLDALTKGTPPEQIRSKEIAAEQAQKALEATWAQRDGICGYGNSAPCDSARAAAIQAEAAVRQAQQQVEIAKARARPEQIAELQAGVDTAKQQAELARRPGGDADLAQARAGVRAAEAGLAAAQRPVVAGQIDAAQAQADAAAAGAALAANPYTAEDLAAARAAVDQAQAAADLARSAIKELTIVAPVDGVVSERQIVVGAVASPATPIVSIVGPQLEVALSVEESALQRIRPEQPAQITVAAFPGQTFNGKVKVIAPTVDPRSRTAVVKVVADADALGKLRPGMFARVNLISEQKAGVLSVPSAALLAEGEPSVFVVGPDGAVRKAAVQVGMRTADRVEIVGGLAEGDRVVVGAADLHEGDKVVAAPPRA